MIDKTKCFLFIVFMLNHSPPDFFDPGANIY